MAYLADFKLSANSDRECGRMYIEDQTAYPLSGNARAVLGIAVFVSDDIFTTIGEYDLSNAEEWIFSVENNKTYHIKGYVVDIYDSGATYNAGTQWKIVQDGDYFYIQSSAAPTGGPGILGGGWSIIIEGQTDPFAGGLFTALKIYDIFEKSLLTETQDYGWSVTYEATRCSLYYVEKIDCHLWQITDNSGGAITVDTVRLRTYDNTLLDSTLTFSGLLLDIDTSAYEYGDDGVFVVEIWGTEGSEVDPSLKASVLIFDLCDAEACYKELFRFVICKCDNPCENVDCEEQYDIAEKRYDMNMLWGLYKLTEQYVFVDKYQYMGILSISETREQFITQVGKMVSKLKVITARCGNCSDTSTNNIDC